MTMTMSTKALATAALAAIIVLAVPSVAFAAVSHTATLTANVVEVTVNAEAHNADLQASVVIMRVGAKYSSPVTDDIVYLNELTLDENGSLTFSATLQGGELDEYVLAFNVAGATERYLVSLDPLGPTPVEPQEPGDGGPTEPGNDGDGGWLATTGSQIALGSVIAFVLGLVAAGVLMIQRRLSIARTPARRP